MLGLGELGLHYIWIDLSRVDIILGLYDLGLTYYIRVK